MSAVVFVQALDAAMARKTTRDANACVQDLTVADLVARNLPALRHVHRSLREPYEGAKLGSLVVAVLRAKIPAAIIAWAFTVSDVKLTERQALQLHGDCYLALADWVTAWNRRQDQVA